MIIDKLCNRQHRYWLRRQHERFTGVKTVLLVMIMSLGGCAQGPTKEQGVTMSNRKVVDNFFVALETQNFELLKEVFAENGRQLNPYVPEGFPKSFDGREAIYKQYSSLPQQFGQMKFPRTIYATEDPNFFFVKYKGDIEIKAGGKYENDYLSTFKLENGKVVEYTEYFNPIVMAKAFGIALK
jgi:ketosteroid isomerase-like protein